MTLSLRAAAEMTGRVSHIAGELRGQQLIAHERMCGPELSTPSARAYYENMPIV
jgi:hypothetical protein